jgi:hypothetical protein
MIKKYKPKVHKVAKKCTEDCELDCNMECYICRNTPFDTDYYFVIEKETDRAKGVQFCRQCFRKIAHEIIRKSKEDKKYP